MPLIKALLLLGGAVPALANRASAWSDGETKENLTSNLKGTSTCCNSDGSVLFHGTNDLWCLSYNCVTMAGGANAFGGFINPANWAEEKTQCHRIGYVTWGELKAGRPDIGQFGYTDLFNDPVYFEHLISKFLAMGALPLCGSLKGVNWNSRPATGSPDDLYRGLTEKIAANPPEEPAHAQPTDMDSQEKGWKLAVLGQDTRKAVYNFEDSMEDFDHATKAPGTGQHALAQGQRNRKKAFITVLLGAFENGKKKSLEAIGGAAEAAYGAPVEILSKAKKMWEAYEEQKKEREEQELREWAKKEYDQMQEEWDRQFLEESRERAEGLRQQQALQDKEAARVRAAKTFGYELKLLEDLVDRGLPDPLIKPTHDEDVALMDELDEKLNGRHGRSEYFAGRVNDRSRAAQMSAPQLFFHAATLRCAREWLECDLRQEDPICADTAVKWVSLLNGGDAAPRCRNLHGEIRTLLDPGARGTKKFPGGFQSVPLPELMISTRGLPLKAEQFKANAQQPLLKTYRFLLEQPQICGDKRYDDTFCQAGDAVLDSIIPPAMPEAKSQIPGAPLLDGQATGWASQPDKARVRGHSRAGTVRID